MNIRGMLPDRYAAITGERKKKTPARSIRELQARQDAMEAGKKVFGVNRLLADPKFQVPAFVITDAVLLLLFRYCINLFAQLRDPASMDLSLANMSLFRMVRLIGLKSSLTVNAAFLLIAAAVNVIYSIRLRISNEDSLNKGQKGTERWTTVTEITEQYQAIPELKEKYPGSGGTMVAHFLGKIYLDNSPTNTLIIGMTRSGKGQMYVIPTLDILSRAEKQSSMVVIDPKLENYKMSRKILQERGYDVRLFNIDDPVHSMGFNPLHLIIEAFKGGRMSEAEMLANTFSYSVFNASSKSDGGSSNEDFFLKTACGLSNALILALVDDCLAEDRRLNEARRQKYDKARMAFDALPEEQKEMWTDRFLAVASEYKGMPPEGSRANRKQLAVSFGKELILDKRVSKIPPTFEFEEVHPHEAGINMYSLVNLFTVLSAEKPYPDNPDITLLDLYFKLRPEGDRAKMKYVATMVAGDRTKSSIYATMAADYQIFTFEDVAKMMSKSSMDLNGIGFGDKPQALFIGIPDYDSSKNFLASVLINQLYFTLAKSATRIKSGKCIIPVKFILDEFGNIPQIADFDHMVTVCLGRGISFDIYIQSLSQITNLYGDNAETITGNCGNQIFILTNDNKTAEEFSKSLGNTTRLDIQRSGNKFSDSKSFTESTSEEALLTPNQLMGLLPGECVVNRTMKRTDLKGRPVHPYPIFNTKWFGTDLPYSYQYLTEYFPNAGDMSLEEANQEDLSGVSLKAITFDPYVGFARVNEAYQKAEEETAAHEKDEEAEGSTESSGKRRIKDVPQLLGLLEGSEIDLGDYGLDEDSPADDLAERLDDMGLNAAIRNMIVSVLNQRDD